jgi:hypothetical protein
MVILGRGGAFSENEKKPHDAYKVPYTLPVKLSDLNM